jgi:hypothetical protein
MTPPKGGAKEIMKILKYLFPYYRNDIFPKINKHIFIARIKNRITDPKSKVYDTTHYFTADFYDDLIELREKGTTSERSTVLLNCFLSEVRGKLKIHYNIRYSLPSMFSFIIFILITLIIGIELLIYQSKDGKYWLIISLGIYVFMNFLFQIKKHEINKEFFTLIKYEE